MKLTDLKKVLQDSNKIREVLDLYKEEINKFQSKVSLIGSSVDVVVDSDLTNIVITAKDLIVLCNSFLQDRLDIFELSYLVDIMTLSNAVSFSTPELFDLASSLTDFEVRYPYEKDDVRNIICKLKKLN